MDDRYGGLPANVRRRVLHRSDGDPVGRREATRSRPEAVATGDNGRTAEPRRSVANVDNGGWSLYGVQRSQPMATGGRWSGRETGSIGESRCCGLPRLPREAHGKEGVEAPVDFGEAMDRLPRRRS